MGFLKIIYICLEDTSGLIGSSGVLIEVITLNTDEPADFPKVRHINLYHTAGENEPADVGTDVSSAYTAHSVQNQLPLFRCDPDLDVDVPIIHRSHPHHPQPDSGTGSPHPHNQRQDQVHPLAAASFS